MGAVPPRDDRGCPSTVAALGKARVVARARKARFLFDVAVAKAWDDEFGALCYSIDLDGAVCNGDKIFWVQCESIGTAAMLATTTGEAKYWAIYDKLWRYSWDKWVDHEHGSWLRRMSREHVPYFTEKTKLSLCVDPDFHKDVRYRVGQPTRARARRRYLT